MVEEKEGFGPLRPGAWVDAGANDAVASGAPFNNFGGVDRTDLGHLLNDRFGERRTPVGVQFIKIKTGGFPVFVQTKCKFETRRPTADFEGYASATIGSYGTKNIEGALSGALNESRLARSKSKVSGESV